MPKQKNPLAAANKARKVKAAARKKEIKSGLAKLKKAGLYTGDVRKASANSHQSRLVKQYADVISGKAVAVKADVNAEVAYRGAGGRGAHGRVVVEKATPGERIRFNKKTGVVEGRRYAYGNEIVRQIYYQKTFDPKKLPKPKKGQRFYYQARFVKGETPRFESLNGFIQYMADYAAAKTGSQKSRAKFQEFWASHVSVEEVVGTLKRGQNLSFVQDEEDDI